MHPNEFYLNNYLFRYHLKTLIYLILNHQLNQYQIHSSFSVVPFYALEISIIFLLIFLKNSDEQF